MDNDFKLGCHDKKNDESGKGSQFQKIAGKKNGSLYHSISRFGTQNGPKLDNFFFITLCGRLPNFGGSVFIKIHGSAYLKNEAWLMER